MSDIATQARAAAVHCEAKKTAYRQTKEGVVISFLFHPNEVPDPVALAQLGTRYLMALVEIGDDEQPISHSGPAPAADSGPSTASVPPTTGAVPGRDTSRESTGSAVENGGNQPPNAREKSAAASERAKANFAALPDMKKDVVRASMMVQDDVTFQRWMLIGDFRRDDPVGNIAWTDLLLKQRLLIQSKSEIGESREVNERWRTLLTTYQRDTNQLAEVRG